MYVHCSIRPFCFAAARLRPASAIPRGKIASSRGGGRGRGGGVERVEQSVAMDSSGMRKRVCLERCDAGLEKLIREVSENGPSPLQSRRVASQACSAVRVKAKVAEYQHQDMARLEVKAKKKPSTKSSTGRGQR